MQQVINPCVRCGKPRIDAKSWKEDVGKSLVLFTNSICPDASCQKIVESEIEERRLRKEAIMNKNKQSFSSNKQSFSSNKQSFSSNKNLSSAQNLDSRSTRIKQSLRSSASPAGLKKIPVVSS